MKDRHAHPLRDEGAEGAVGVSQHKQAVGPLFLQGALRRRHDGAHALAERPAADPEVAIGRTHPQLVEEDVAQGVLEVLACVRHVQVAHLVEALDHTAQPDDLRARPQDD